MTKAQAFCYFLKNHVGPFFCRFLLYVCAITAIFYASIWCTFRFSQGDYTYQDATFNWTYSPKDNGYLPIDPEYNDYNILLDGHSHTTYSDGSLSPEQNLLWHIANGYNAIILSDHNTVQGGTVAQQIAREKYDDQIKVIVAQEYSCCRIHMNLIGINQTIPSTAWPTDDELRAVINQTHALGGLVSVNHIPWSYYQLYDIPTIETLYELGVDYVEIVNQNTFDYQDYLWAKNHSMGVITGTDMHNPARGVNGWTTLISNFTEEAIMEALREKKTSIIYTAIDTPYLTGPEGTPSNLALDPFFRIGALLLGYYSYHETMWSFNGSYCGTNTLILQWKLIWIFVAWLAGAFVFFEVLRQLFELIWGKLSAKFKCCNSDKKKDGYFALNTFDRDSRMAE